MHASRGVRGGEANRPSPRRESSGRACGPANLRHQQNRDGGAVLPRPPCVQVMVGVIAQRAPYAARYCTCTIHTQRRRASPGLAVPECQLGDGMPRRFCLRSTLVVCPPGPGAADGVTGLETPEWLLPPARPRNTPSLVSSASPLGITIAVLLAVDNTPRPVSQTMQSPPGWDSAQIEICDGEGAALGTARSAKAEDGRHESRRPHQ